MKIHILDVNMNQNYSFGNQPYVNHKGHTILVGQSGAGKSYTLKKILAELRQKEELLLKEKAEKLKQNLNQSIKHTPIEKKINI